MPPRLLSKKLERMLGIIYFLGAPYAFAFFIYALPPSYAFSPVAFTYYSVFATFYRALYSAPGSIPSTSSPGSR